MTTTTHPPTTAMAIIDPQRVPLAVQTFGADRITLLAEQVGRGWKVPPTAEELEVIALICDRNRLDIFAKPPQIHFIKRYDSKLSREVMTPQVSVDGMRLIARRSREYVGPAGYSWCGDDGVWKDLWLAKEPPRAARAGVFLRGHREPLYAVAMWDEWKQEVDEYRNNQKTGNKVLAPFWAAKPAHMLAKTAEMMILKQTCPAETNEFELAHLEELDRLEAPSLVEQYNKMYGADESQAFAELPSGAGAPSYEPPRERDDLEDLPRENDAVVIESAPPAATQQEQPAAPSNRGDLLEMYSHLLTTARQSGVISDDQMGQWVIPKGSSEVDIISKGRDLRALVNQEQVARASGQVSPSVPEKPEMVGVRSIPYNRMSELVEEAARLEVDYDDLRIPSWPVTAEEAQRKIERLEERIQAKKDRLAGIARPPDATQTPAF